MLSYTRWVTVKNVPPLLWAFLPQLLTPLGNAIRIEESKVILLHMDLRALILLLLGMEISKIIDINVGVGNIVIDVKGEKTYCY